ncbi:MAG: PepSY domain-containing protein [Acidaminococcaceae bacterium]|nr:PepSY domain-containing protein [Acidaminococcaceae bacterium]
MLKKMLIACITLVMLLFTSVGFAANANEYEPAIAVAKAEVPAGAVLYRIDDDKDDADLSLTFYDGGTLLSYEVEVVKATNKVKEVEIKGSNLPGSTRINKTQAEIREIVLAAYPDAKNIKIEIETEGNLKYYEAEFTTEKFKAELAINPVTGAICKRELKYF